MENINDVNGCNSIHVKEGGKHGKDGATMSLK